MTAAENACVTPVELTIGRGSNAERRAHLPIMK